MSFNETVGLFSKIDRQIDIRSALSFFIIDKSLININQPQKSSIQTIIRLDSITGLDL